MESSGPALFREKLHGLAVGNLVAFWSTQVMCYIKTGIQKSPVCEGCGKRGAALQASTVNVERLQRASITKRPAVILAPERKE